MPAFTRKKKTSALGVMIVVLSDVRVDTAVRTKSEWTGELTSQWDATRYPPLRRSDPFRRSDPGHT